MANSMPSSGKLRWTVTGLIVAASLLAISGVVRAQHAPPPPLIDWAEQGWTQADRDVFHRTSQGSHILPLAWFRALRRLDRAEPFGADQLARYGYLTDDSAANTDHLPIGFVVDDRSSPAQLGMTCAACHTGEVDYVKAGVTHALRIDGAPASADFQQFLTDLAAAARSTLADPERWNAFAKAVLGPNPADSDVAQLHSAFSAWTDDFGGYMDASLPKAAPWGPGRLDAFGMIFNRVAGHDLRTPGNLIAADAPVSYPFLWDAPKQDHTQWNGLAPNGLEILGMVRNTGEVMGVFADFEPSRVDLPIPLIQFGNNSIWFDHLQTLEEKVVALKAPQWPAAFPFNKALADKGKPIFDAQCARCHGVNPSKIIPWIWDTPVQAVGTDPWMSERSARVSATAIYQGSLAPRLPVSFYGAAAPTTDMLVTSVVGAMLHEAITPPFGDDNPIGRAVSHDRAAAAEGGPMASNQTLQDPISAVTSNQDALYKKPAPRTSAAMAASGAATPGAAYEARVLTGVWATAPYLHNGSVANLWELLTPPARRKTTFMAGNRLFDPVNVGFRTEASPSPNSQFRTSVPGNSAAGHDFGTSLSPADKRALIEYLKTL